MKKCLALLLVLGIMLTVAACRNSGDATTVPGSSAPETTGGVLQTTQPSTVAPTTVPPTTEAPTTVSTTVAATTVPIVATTAPPAICDHDWSEATCTAPKTCAKCGATEGSAAGHSWNEATCTAPKTCKTCGKSEGKAAEHSWSEATCTAPKACKVCGKTEGSVSGHSWKGATETTSKICTLCGASEGTRYGYDELASAPHGAAMQSLYRKLVTACEAFADNQKNIAQSDGMYMIARLEFDLSAMTMEDAFAVWKVFKLDQPQYYWLSNTVNVSENVLELCIDAIYADGAYREKCDKALADMVGACGEKLTAGMSQVEKAMAIHDYIIERMDYAYESDGVTPQDDAWAHNLLGCAEKKLGVCEAYAKTYQYLCRYNGLECILVTGETREEHAWNLVKVDGKWYGVDCTFDDTGSDGLCYLNFGMSAAKMNEGYTVDTPVGVGADYLYKLPQLAPYSIGLVDLYKNGNLVGRYLSVDDAFAAMTDSKGEYAVQLFDYGSNGPMLMSTSAVEYHIVSTKTPRVKSLTIRGLHIDMGNGYYTRLGLWVDSDLVLQSNLTVTDLAVYGEGSVDLKKYKLSCLGNSVDVHVPITGSLDPNTPSQLHMGVKMSSEFYDTVQVHTLSQSDDYTGGMLFRKDTTIIKAKVGSVTIYDTSTEGVSVKIQEFCPPADETYTGIVIEGPAKVKVEKITIPDAYVDITLRFGKLEEFGTVTIGSCNASVHLTLSGQQMYVSTDMNGNEIDRWTESVDPVDIPGPIATLQDKSVMDNLKIYFVEWDGGCGQSVERTDEYKLNSKNQIVLK